MQKNTLVQLIKDIKSHKKVISHQLLSQEVWKKSAYSQLSDLISDYLLEVMSDKDIRSVGTSVSLRTLEKLFKNTYKLTNPIDPRSLNTLNKLSIFCGYEGFRELELISKKKEDKKLEKSNDTKEILENFLSRALNTQFLFFRSIPKGDKALEDLSLYYLSSATYLKEMAEINYLHGQKNYILSNPFNPSDFELIETEVVLETKYRVEIKSKELWMLCWWDSIEQRYVRRHKRISEFSYIFVKDKEGNWKIKLNTNEEDYLVHSNNLINNC